MVQEQWYCEDVLFKDSELLVHLCKNEPFGRKGCTKLLKRKLTQLITMAVPCANLLEMMES